MVVLYRFLSNPCLLFCVLLLELNNVLGCLREPNTVFPQRFLFEALPSVNVTLGEKLELRCIAKVAGNSSELSSMALLTRVHRNGQLNAMCVVSGSKGSCSYQIEKIDVGDIGTYDCIKIHKDKNCYSKTLKIHMIVETTTVALKTLQTETPEITSTTNFGTNKEKPSQTDWNESLALTTPSAGTTFLTSNALKFVAMAACLAVLFTGC